MPTVDANPVTRLAEAFQRHGKQLYLVGGSVRDDLLGRPGKDLDLTTDARPEEVKRLAMAAKPSGLYTVGERFGTIGLVFGDLHVEITTFRAEQYPPHSRKPVVSFGTSLADDLSRRDFTINALARDVLSGRLFDPYGGLRDLRDKVVRAVGVPAERFAEDPLRLLRAVRFAVQLGFDIDPETAAGIAETASTLAKISRERVAEEMNRILLSPEPTRGVRLLWELGLLPFVIPEMMEMVQMDQGRYRHKDVFEHTLLVLERVAPDLPLRWAALLHDIAKPRTFSYEGGEVRFWGHEHLGEQIARSITQRLRLDGRTVEAVARLVRMHLRANQFDETWTDGAVRRLVREAGEDLWRLFDLSRADVTSHRPLRVELALARVAALEQRCRELAQQEAIESLHSPLDGNDLMALFGRGPGPWIGRVKDYLFDLVLEGDLDQEDRTRAEELARAFLSAEGL
ncbi:MAG: CCA tRNA nucleotidyltransferase [Chloroflexi bacterium]|nr:CCA tRNA nucleotidyltransferase [Chloroflexota bacterium]